MSSTMSVAAFRGQYGVSGRKLGTKSGEALRPVVHREPNILCKSPWALARKDGKNLVCVCVWGGGASWCYTRRCTRTCGRMECSRTSPLFSTSLVSAAQPCTLHPSPRQLLLRNTDINISVFVLLTINLHYEKYDQKVHVQITCTVLWRA